MVIFLFKKLKNQEISTINILINIYRISNSIFLKYIIFLNHVPNKKIILDN